jgi:Na+/H+-dicarboxylate symporter
MKGVVARWLAVPLWQRILLALVLGAVAGAALGPQMTAIGWVGELFIRLIRMLIVPLVFSTLVAGMVSMDMPGRLLGMAVKTLALYLVTTLFAVTIGLGLAVALQPGAGVDVTGAAPMALGEAIPLGRRMMNIVPDNVIAAFAAGDVLAVIFFSGLLGVGLLKAGEAGRPFARGVTALSEAMLKMTGIVMEMAPFGVFALVAVSIGKDGGGAFLNVLKLGVIVYLGGLLHILVTQVGLVWLAGGMRPGAFLKAVRAPQLMAYSSSSSAATLPLTMAAARDELGVSGPVASAVLPLGATVNMDGTALYVAAVAVFAAQLFGVALGLEDYVLIALTTVLVSVGTASVPSASLFLMAAVLEVAGISPAQAALVIGFVLPFDRILDMWRTMVNVTGDLAVARVIQAGEAGRS